MYIIIFSFLFSGFFTLLLHYFTKYYYKFKAIKSNLNSKINGGIKVAEALKKNNVDKIFTLIGGHISPILVESKRLGIRILDVRNEANAVFAADAVSRISNSIGVAIVTAGPGITNTITAIKNAQMAESPLLLIGGSAATLLKGRGALQDIDQERIMKHVCKRVFICNNVQELGKVINDAIYVAKSCVPGPVFVEIPIDLLYPIKTVLNNAGIKEESGIKKAGLIKRLVNKYIKYKIYYNFLDFWKYQNIIVKKPYFPAVTEKDVNKFTKIVSSC